jgi:hypothetical protein
MPGSLGKKRQEPGAILLEPLLGLGGLLGRYPLGLMFHPRRFHQWNHKKQVKPVTTENTGKSDKAPITPQQPLRFIPGKWWEQRTCLDLAS